MKMLKEILNDDINPLVGGGLLLFAGAVFVALKAGDKIYNALN